MTSLDAFVDHEGAFLRYMEAQEAIAIGESLGLHLREVHSIHSKVGNLDCCVTFIRHLTGLKLNRGLESHFNPGLRNFQTFRRRSSTTCVSSF